MKILSQKAINVRIILKQKVFKLEGDSNLGLRSSIRDKRETRRSQRDSSQGLKNNGQEDKPTLVAEWSIHEQQEASYSRQVADNHY